MRVRRNRTSGQSDIFGTTRLAKTIGTETRSLPCSHGNAAPKIRQSKGGYPVATVVVPSKLKSAVYWLIGSS